MSRKKTYKIRPLVITELQCPMPGMTYLSGFGETVTSTGYIWYIEGPKERIIVDTGGKAETLDMLGFPAKDVKSPEEALLKLGLRCEDVDIVIQTLDV